MPLLLRQTEKSTPLDEFVRCLPAVVNMWAMVAECLVLSVCPFLGDGLELC
jgi:hypothetical protein